MNIKHFLLSLSVGALLIACTGSVDYKDAKAPIDGRVNDLLGKMTVEEKVAQLQSQLLFMNDYPAKRRYDIGHVRNIGHFMHAGPNGPSSASQCAAAINEDTKKSIEANRLGIPVLQHGEALHGAQWGMGTCFPQSIAMAATFDDECYFRAGQVVAQELRAVGVRQVYAPVINLSRDPRWGRTQEGYGEDVLVNSRMGVAYVKALEQGGIVASPKHFVDNYGDGGHDSYASNNSWRTLREIFLEPFRAAFVEGGARSVMAAYNSIDGVPCSANKKLLTDILRDEWKFKGYVVSDYGGVWGVAGSHHVAENTTEAQAQSLQAGMDLELASGGDKLLEALKNGRISQNDINQAVRRVLTIKFELGLFDEPLVDATKADQIVRSPEHKALALEAARKCMTLLKNDNNTLPFDEKKIKRIALFGSAADKLSLGDYAGPYGDGWKGDGSVTPYQGLKARLAGKAEVVLVKPGTNVNAKNFDAVVYFASIREGEGMDRSHLELPTQQVKAAESSTNAVIIEAQKDLTIDVDQEKTIRELAASGIPTVVVLQNGSTIDIHKWIDDVDAILEAWYPGEQGGQAIAEALVGDINPGGRLPFTWARHAGQLPIYYDIKPSGRGYSYNDDNGKPLMPFGFGLSYTTFDYSNLEIPAQVKPNEDFIVKVTVKNTGTRKGDEVVQLYMHDELASVARPIKQLKAFKRVTLEAGESKTVELTLPYRSFGLWNRDLNFVYEPGLVTLWIAKNAATTQEEATKAGLSGQTQVL